MSTRNLLGGKGLTILPPSVSRLSRKCGSLDISSTACYRDSFTFIAVRVITGIQRICLNVDMNWIYLVKGNFYEHCVEPRVAYDKGKVVPVTSLLSTAPGRRMGEWIYRFTYS
jgi:hypothetical protein